MDDKDLAQAAIQGGPAPGSRWRHYKGGEYEIIANALDEATLRHLVVYRAPKGTTWVRTIEDWSAMVEIDGVQKRRFTPLD
jgi:hypothetical protein